MIDLRKPLEGVPGLLLMASLILFGMTVGMSIVILFELIKLSDALWNFLGGVVGAGLGAALAVLGSVYVQRQERRDQLTAPINAVIEGLRKVSASLTAIRLAQEWARQHPEPSIFAPQLNRLYDSLESQIESVPAGTELPAELHSELEQTKRSLGLLTLPLRKLAVEKPDSDDALAYVQHMATLVLTLTNRLSVFQRP